VVKRLGGNPAHLADLLERMEARLLPKINLSAELAWNASGKELRALRLRNPGTAEETKR
jgi:hypothetical protein